MKTSKKYLAFALVSVLMLSALTGCSNKNGGDSGKFDTAREINVLTREDGSGTRGAGGSDEPPVQLVKLLIHPASSVSFVQYETVLIAADPIIVRFRTKVKQNFSPGFSGDRDC